MRYPVILIASAVAVMLAVWLGGWPVECHTDTECARMFGGSGGPEDGLSNLDMVDDCTGEEK